MTIAPFTLSVVCPAFNEENVLPLFHRELACVLDELPADCKVEVIYVDDGSRDKTLPVLREIMAQDPRVRYLSFTRNFGHQAALTAGLEASQGDVVVTMDSDLQHPPALIPLLLQRWREGHEVVITIRDDNKGAGWMERVMSRWFYAFLSRMSETEIRPAAADFRLMSRCAVDAFLLMRDRHRFLRGMVQWLGFPTAEVHYTAPQRAAGVSKYNLRRKVRFALDGLLSFSKAPLRLPIAAGLLVMVLGVLIGGYAGLRSILRQDGVLLTLLIGSCHAILGAILCTLGIIGEYLGRIYDQVRFRPNYVLKEQGSLLAQTERIPPPTWPGMAPSADPRKSAA